MTRSDTAISDPAILNAGFAQQALRFARDFAAFAGMAGVWGAVLASPARHLKAWRLVLLVPLLSIVTATDNSPGWVHKSAFRFLDLAGAETRAARLSTLLGIFVVLIVVRAVVTAQRDMHPGRTTDGICRADPAHVAQQFAAAPWPVVSRLQHARVTHLMSGDIQRIGSAANFIVQFLAALVLMVFQIAIAFFLGPALAGLALGLIAIGALASFVMLGRAHDLGTRLSRTSIALLHETTQFLGGLKLAAGQNRQADFVSEFEASLAAMKRQQIAYIRQQTASRLAATIITGLVGALIAFIGLTVFETPPPVLIAMLLVFARISGPVMQMSQAAQQFAHMLPAYAEVSQLDRDLASGAACGTKPYPSQHHSGHRPGRDRAARRQLSLRRTRQPAGAIIDFSLTIEPGSFIGVSGPSGAGKTTFADLLIGLLEPQSGEISVGGTPLRGAAAVMWRDHVSYVAQDPYLFRDTIRRNLLWASPQASEDRNLAGACHRRRR